MDWNEDNTVEEPRNSMLRGNNTDDVGSKSKKKNNKKNHNKFGASFRTMPSAEDIQVKGPSHSLGYSSGWVDYSNNNNNNNTQRQRGLEQGSSQVSSGFGGSQFQKMPIYSYSQEQANSTVNRLEKDAKDEGWEVASSRKSRLQNNALNLPSTANKAKGVSSTGFQQDGDRKVKPGFGGAVQKPGRWDDGKNRANNCWDQSYKSPGVREGFASDSKAQKIVRSYNRAPRNEGWLLEKEGRRKQARQSNARLHPENSERSWESAYVQTGKQNVPLPLPLAQGWQWEGRVGNSDIGSGKDLLPQTYESTEISNVKNNVLANLLPSEQSGGTGLSYGEAGFQSSCSEPESMEEESDDGWLGSDDYDSNASEVSHETQKKNKWFRKFFQSLDALTIEEVNESVRQWHCPACQGGVGAIDWYRGMQPLLAHAKTVRSKRVKLHRKLAEILEEELKRRGAAGLAAEEMFGKWKGLREATNNQEIVWPPMVIIQNTLLDQDENDMWLGMGNKELLEYFKGYKAMKARHAYGPHGHRGMSVLIFEDSAMGYLEAERLHKHFLEEGRERDAWDRRRVMFHPGGKRVLYGYMATKEDMEIFNRHSKGRARLKYDIRTYQSMVVEPMRKMNEDNQKLIWFKNKVAKEQQHSKTLEETVSIVGRKLRMKEDEIKIIRHRATEQHEESKREMDYLEQSYRQQIDQLFEDIARREQKIENIQEEFKKVHIDRCHQLEVDSAKFSKDMKIGKDEQEQHAKYYNHTYDSSKEDSMMVEGAVDYHY